MPNPKTCIRSRPLAPLAVCLALVGVARPAPAEDLRDLVEEVLDKPIAGVRIEGQPIREALQQLGAQTGMSFVLDDATLGLMPYGGRTKISVVLSGDSLRKSLTQMFDGLGLVMRLYGDKLHVLPGPMLERLGRRLSIEEVRLLHELAAHPWAALPEPRPPIQFRALNEPEAQQALDAKIAQTVLPNALRQLETATQALGWVWVPQERSIVIMTRAEDVYSRLERPITLDYRGIRLDDLLMDLGQKVGVTVLFEGGVLERIQADNRAVDLIDKNTTALQTLERICGSTNTCFEVTEDGVLIAAPEDSARPTRPAAGARVVAILRVPVGEDGTTVDFPFYDDNVPDEFRRLLDQKLPAVLEDLRRKEN